LVFITADTYSAYDSNIADYNALVTAEADSVPALAALDTTWSVLGSTSTVSAINNIGADPGVPIYNLEGYEIASDVPYLVTGDWYNTILYDENGDDFETGGQLFAWTGTQPNGQIAPCPLGNEGNCVAIGDSDLGNGGQGLDYENYSGPVRFRSTPYPAYL